MLVRITKVKCKKKNALDPFDIFGGGFKFIHCHGTFLIVRTHVLMVGLVYTST